MVFFSRFGLWVLWVSRWILCVWIWVFVCIFGDDGGGVCAAAVGLVVVVTLFFVVGGWLLWVVVLILFLFGFVGMDLAVVATVV